MVAQQECPSRLFCVYVIDNSDGKDLREYAEYYVETMKDQYRKEVAIDEIVETTIAGFTGYRVEYEKPKTGEWQAHIFFMVDGTLLGAAGACAIDDHEGFEDIEYIFASLEYLPSYW